MLGFAIHAIVEGLSGRRMVDPRLAPYLPKAQEDGLKIATRLSSLIEKTHPERRYFDAALLGFQGDLDGYRHRMEDIAAIESLQAKKAQMAVSPRLQEPNRETGNPSSWSISTFS